MNDTVEAAGGAIAVRDWVSELVVEFDPFEKRLAEYRGRYMNVVYDLDDPEQERRARSDRLALGKVIAELDRRHARLKGPLLDATRALDGRRKQIKDSLLEIQGSIKAQLQAKERKEAERAAELQRRIGEIQALVSEPVDRDVTSEELERALEKAVAIEIGQDWEERRADAALARTEVIEHLQKRIVEVRQVEAERAELQRLRAEKEAKERAEREERIAREAAERARREAEERAAAKERAAAQEHERELNRERRLAAQKIEYTVRAQREAERKAEEARAAAEAQAKAAAEAAKAKAKAEEEAEALRAREAQAISTQALKGAADDRARSHKASEARGGSQPSRAIDKRLAEMQAVDALIKVCHLDPCDAHRVVASVESGHIPGMSFTY